MDNFATLTAGHDLDLWTSESNQYRPVNIPVQCYQNCSRHSRDIVVKISVWTNECGIWTTRKHNAFVHCLCRWHNNKKQRIKQQLPCWWAEQGQQSRLLEATFSVYIQPIVHWRVCELQPHHTTDDKPKKSNNKHKTMQRILYPCRISKRSKI